MEKNFIQMAASAGHAVANTIGPIHISTLSIVCNCISPMSSRILFFKASIVIGLGVKLQLRGGQTTSALRLKMRSSKTGRKILSVASSVWHHKAILLKPNVANILLFNFCEQKFVQQRSPLSVTASPCSISKKNVPIMFLNQNPHQTVTRFGCVGFSMYACGFSVPQMRLFRLFTYTPRWKWGIFCKSTCHNISQRCSSVNTTIFVRRMDKTNYLSNQTWAKCYHSRSTSWKKC